MLIFKITIILNAISSKIATRMMLIKENLLVVHTKKFVKFRAPHGVILKFTFKTQSLKHKLMLTL